MVEAASTCKKSKRAKSPGLNLRRLIIGHEFSHSLRMDRINVTVSVENQLAAVAMALPIRDHLNINTMLDCPSDEHSPKRSVTECGHL